MSYLLDFSMKNRINRILCIFENLEFEEKFQKEEWGKYLPYKSIIIILAGLPPILGLITGIVKGVYSDVPMNSLFAVISTIVFFIKDDGLIRKLFPLVIFLVFAIIFPANLIFNFNPDSYNANLIPLLPILTSLIILRLMPISFAMGLFVSFISQVSTIYIQDHSTLSIFEYLFFLIPYFILIFDKRRSELNKRIEFSQKEIIENTKKIMHETLNRYFGQTLSDKILSEEGNLTGEIKWVSISFTDIASYSTIIENMSPEVAVKLLNEYFTRMHDVIEKHGGQILNYIGDAIMVVFGAPNPVQEHEIKAVECAIEMRDALTKLNENWDKNESSRYWKNHGIENITVRTGIHTGSVIAGNIGSDRMLQYSAIGDVVNVAARLEQANKEFDTNICISEEIYINLTKSLHDAASFSGEIILKGRKTPSKVYTI